VTIAKIESCNNVKDFRHLARQRLPFPIFDYIDGAADDELTKARNSSAFDDCDLVPNVLTGVEQIDLSATIMGQKVSMPLMLSPTALQRLFHWQGERAVGAVAQSENIWFGISSLATVSLEEIGASIASPKMFQFYYHRDKGLNAALIARAKLAGFNALTLTVDTIVGGNRERCLRSGFTSPPRITPRSFLSYAAKPRWALNYLLRERFALPNLDSHVAEGTNIALSVADYFNNMLDQSLDWAAAEALAASWSGQFCLKGIMSVDDARRAADIGASAIMVSNHGGRQLDGSRAPFDQLAEIVDAVGDRIDVILDGGVRRGTHILKALSLGAKGVSGGRLYLYALAAGGQAGVARAVSNLRRELERDMKLMGVTRIDQLHRGNLRWR
jgi:L-lactate dehydrogenase (cytochrome)